MHACMHSDDQLKCLERKLCLTSAYVRAQCMIAVTLLVYLSIMLSSAADAPKYASGKFMNFQGWAWWLWLAVCVLATLSMIFHFCALYQLPARARPGSSPPVSPPPVTKKLSSRGGKRTGKRLRDDKEIEVNSLCEPAFS